jgi:hypothetical protein
MLAITASKKEDLLLPVLPGVKYVVTAQMYHSKYLLSFGYKKKRRKINKHMKLN